MQNLLFPSKLPVYVLSVRNDNVQKLKLSLYFHRLYHTALRRCGKLLQAQLAGVSLCKHGTKHVHSKCVVFF